MAWGAMRAFRSQKFLFVRPGTKFPEGGLDRCFALNGFLRSECWQHYLVTGVFISGGPAPEKTAAAPAAAPWPF